MKAIILAAGIGQRMRPITDTTHKTLLVIDGETIMARIVLNLIAVGISRIVIVTGYRSGELRAHLKQRFPDLNFQYVHNPKFRTTNNIVSLHLALESDPIDSDLLLIESDLVFEVTALKRLLSNPHANVALVDQHASGMDGTVVTVDDGLITGVIPPHLQGSHFSFEDKFKTLNIYKFSRQFCDETLRQVLGFYVRTLADQSYYELILGVIIYLRAAQIHAEIVTGETWCEIDDPNDLLVARFTFTPAARQEILQRGQGGFWNYHVLDYCFLRNPFFPSPAVLSELENGFRNVIGHYGSAQSVLDAKVAYFQLCEPERMVALNGLSQIYPWLSTYFAGKRVLIPAPTFGEYARAFPHAATYPDSECGFDLAQISNDMEKADVVCFVNPNNPTGSLLPSAWIFDAACLHAEKTFIVDESFLDFSTQPSLLERFATEPLPNILLLKSLSKSLGVPGLRLGWAYSANLKLLQELRASMPIWNLNSVAENFLEIILKHRQEIRASFLRTCIERESLRASLATLPFVDLVAESHANFLLVKFRCSVETLERKIDLLLQRSRIYLKSCSGKFGGREAYARLAVGTPKDDLRLIVALRDVFAHE